MSSEKTLICYRGACDNAAHPCGYNRVTHGMYCLSCARLIERRSMDVMGGKLYPLLSMAGQVSVGGSWETGLIRYRTDEPRDTSDDMVNM